MREELIIEVWADPVDGEWLGGYLLKAFYALGGTSITAQPWQVAPNSFGELWYQLRLWMKVLHARVLGDVYGPPLNHKSGQMVAFDLLQVDVRQSGEDHEETAHQWLVAGLRTFQLVILLARGPCELPAVFRQHELQAAAPGACTCTSLIHSSISMKSPLFPDEFPLSFFNIILCTLIL